MGKVYGYCMISNARQSMEKQKRSILAEFPEALIVAEEYVAGQGSGQCFNELLEQVGSGDTIVFESVSKMSMDAQKGSDIYLELYHAGVELVFLKQRQIDTAVYRKAISAQMDVNRSGFSTPDQPMREKQELLKEFAAALAREQIKVSYRQTEKEMSDFRQRTKEGLKAAKQSGKQVGLPKGSTLITKKEKEAVPKIRELNQHFGGPLNDQDTAKEIGISRQSVAKYIARMLSEDPDNPGNA